jgi:hypothetical protein
LHVRQLPKGAAAGVFSGLQQLQDLTLQWDDDSATSLDVLQGVTPSLTKLMLDELASPERFSISSVPALAGFSALQHLEVVVSPGGAGMDCGFLGSMPHVAQLRVLRLAGWLNGDAVHELLSVLPRMTNLVHFDVVSDQWKWGTNTQEEPQPVADVTRYTALLPASPQLTHFALTAYMASMLPVGCGCHVFAAGRQLPSLKVLCLGPAAERGETCGPNSLPGPYDYLYYSGHDRDASEFEQQFACVGPGDVERLVCCCPALEQLWLPGLVQVGVDVSALLRLTALTGLFVGGAVWDDDVAVAVLAEMSGLRELQLCDAPGFTDAGLLALSALTGLTKLGTLHCGLSTALLTPYCRPGLSWAEGGEENGSFRLSAEVGTEGAYLLCQQLCPVRML